MLSLLCGCIILNSVVVANGAYFYKRLQYNATDQAFNSIMEQVGRDAAYQPGVTPVALIGNLNDSYIGRSENEYFAPFSGILGVNNRTSITYIDVFESYCRFVRGMPINLITDTTEMKMIGVQRAVRLMPPYPQDGYCQMVDGVMVIKVSDWP